jgi:hypothetical protein
MTFSAASPGAIAHTIQIHPSSQPLAPRVEFIYTPVVQYFDFAFNSLCIASRIVFKISTANLSRFLTMYRAAPVAAVRCGDRRPLAEGKTRGQTIA